MVDGRVDGDGTAPHTHGLNSAGEDSLCFVVMRDSSVPIFRNIIVALPLFRALGFCDASGGALESQSMDG